MGQTDKYEWRLVEKDTGTVLVVANPQDIVVADAATAAKVNSALTVDRRPKE